MHDHATEALSVPISADANPPRANGANGKVLAAFKKVLPTLVPGLFLLLAWELGSRVLFDATLLGRPSGIFESLIEHVSHSKIWYDAWVTASEVVIGYSFGIVFGFLTGYLVGIGERAAGIIEPYVLLINAIPKVAIAPLLIVVFGIGLASKIAIIVSLVFFLMFYAVYVGIRTIDVEFIYQARIMGISRGGEIFKVVLPAILPNVLVGLKTSATSAIIGAMIGEVVASRAGIGFFILEASGAFDADSIWVGVIFLMFLLLLLTGAIALIEARFLRWIPRKRF